MSPAIRSSLPYAALVAILAILGLWLWSSVSTFASPEPEGISVVCSDAECGRHFIIPRTQSRTYPRGPHGEGFKCQSCGKFSAQIAVQCEACSHWYLPGGGPGRGETGCPRCTITQPQ
jgi:hypothetical protein